MSPTKDEQPERIGLHNLAPAPGSRRPRKRIGRGEGSGTGKTSGRGQKGAGSRTGSKSRAAFEGGQMPIHMRMRKLRGLRTPEEVGRLRGLSINQVLGLTSQSTNGAPHAAEGETETPAAADAPDEAAAAPDADASAAANGAPA